MLTGASAMPQERFVLLDGLRFHLVDWGGPPSRAIVLLHGLASQAHILYP